MTASIGGPASARIEAIKAIVKEHGYELLI